MTERPEGRLARVVRSATAVAVLTVLGVAAGAGLTATPASAAAGCTVNVVAHPDDDLFFQNPAVRNDIVARKCVGTVYVTSGDAGQGAAYSRNREKGVQAAYAKMAGVSNKWQTKTVASSGQTVTTSTLLTAPQISLTFLRLPDGNPDGSGTSASAFTSLQQLHLGEIASLKTVDSPVQTYTWAGLVKTVGKVLTTLNATTVRTLDHLGDYDEGDHSDHYTVARLAALARATYMPSAALVGYLGYPGESLSANVTGAEHTAKLAALMAYVPYDPSTCQTLQACTANPWVARQHLATALHPARPVTPGNVAPVATVSASSQNTATGQTAKKAIDGIVDGFPGKATAEWATNGGGAGSWLQLNWLEPIQMDKVVLYDRPNTSDWVTGGKLTFSDGSTVAVPKLDNAGGPVTVTFKARVVSSLRLTITTVGPATGSVGLAEFQAWTSGSTPTYSPAPVPPPITPTAPVPPPVEPVVCGTPTSPTTATVPTPSTMPAVSTDLAAAASVTASSENAADGQTAAKAVDGTVDGYPGDWTAEWAAQGCTAGTWLQLTWPTAVTLDRIVLHDRPNANDQVTGGTLTFADGTTVAVPELANDGSATTVSFPARSTTSVRLTVTGVSATTSNVGLAEVQAWTAVPAPAAPPVVPVVCGTPTSPTTATVPTPSTMPAVSTDLAAAASVTASSENAADGQTAAKAVDGTVDGYPGDWTAEWAAQGCTAGTWLQLTWPTAVTLDRIVLHDRPNANDQVTGGTLTFADGTTVAVPELANDGSATTVSFPARSTTSVRLTVTGVSPTTSNVGLAELQAWTAVPAAPVTVQAPAPAPAPAPTTTVPSTVDLAPTSTLTGGVGTQWNGVGSWIQLNWRQAVTTGRIVITDPTGTLGLTGATVTFSDGTTATVPVQAIDGKTLALVFPPRSTTTLRLTVTSMKGTLANADKAGLQVFAS
ncbi:hypothetical protein E4P39_04525 [Blastococcus sp. CT_GayMR19]|uniref:DUF7402 domain-containing protein n=1 Tax=Blastococcus sp. CT_GayMR19 TaxID=2559608 RepID=UPI00107457D7|nr:discoidin domain-containing protein [Blastococcus sp. CT_GayMR19]TFV78466.1 hypothetical protein E4P39_04525 [Blastococcus sp. CT_GayMR19]